MDDTKIFGWVIILGIAATLSVPVVIYFGWLELLQFVVGLFVGILIIKLLVFAISLIEG